MPAPVVQSLDQILASLDPAYSGQEAVIGQQQAAIPGKYAGQQAGLEVAKSNTFRDINRGANAKGLAFSGIPIEEQTRYTGEKYLPALAGIETQKNTESMSLSAALASLQGEKRLRALDTQGAQTRAATDYANQQELRAQQEAFDRWKIANDQQFQTKMENLKAANARSSQPTVADRMQADSQAIFNEFNSVRGKDGYISPVDYNRALAQWKSAGYDPSTFARTFSIFRNPKNPSYQGLKG